MAPKARAKKKIDTTSFLTQVVTTQKKKTVTKTVATSRSKWKWKDCKQFAELEYEQDLGLPLVDKKDLLPAEKVFLDLPALIEENMAVEKEEDMEKEIQTLMTKNQIPLADTGTLKENTNLVRSLLDAVEEEKSKKRKEKKIDVVAVRLLELCGIEQRPFKWTAAEFEFKMCGVLCNSEPDVFVILADSKELIIIFENKTGQWRDDGFVAQIVSEMIMCHYTNGKKAEQANTDPPDRVYCVRVFLHYVSLFALDYSKDKIDDICNKGDVPTPKLTMYCDTEHANTGTGKGFDLLIPDAREHIVGLLASIRQSITNNA